MNNDAINDLTTRHAAREVFTAIKEDGFTILTVDHLDADDAYFTVTNPDGRKFRVTVTPED